MKIFELSIYSMLLLSTVTYAASSPTSCQSNGLGCSKVTCYYQSQWQSTHNRPDALACNFSSTQWPLTMYCIKSSNGSQVWSYDKSLGAPSLSCSSYSIVSKATVNYVNQQAKKSNGDWNPHVGYYNAMSQFCSAPYLTGYSKKCGGQEKNDSYPMMNGVTAKSPVFSK